VISEREPEQELGETFEVVTLPRMHGYHPIFGTSGSTV
jgi:hypothetical protein